VGADTVRLRSRADVNAYETAGRLRHQELGGRRVAALVDGMRVEVARDGLVCVEGRVAGMLDQSHDLSPASRLADVEEAVEAALTSHGFEVDELAVGRLDLAADLRFDNGADGLALLRAAAAANLPWLKAGTEGEKRTALETVYWRTMTGRSVQLRLYDKGVETGLAAPGTWLRLERQIRWRKTRERPVAALVTADLGALFRARYLEALTNVPDVVHTNRQGAFEHLRRSYLASPRTGRDGLRFERLAGFLLTGGEGLSRSTYYDRWSELDELGLAVELDAAGTVTVPVGAYLELVSEAWAA
jgi:hypothetical protein